MKAWMMILASLSLTTFANAADLTGTWRTIDDKTGVVRAHIKMTKQADGGYIGTLVEDFPAAGETPLVTCNKCPAPYTNKPIIGLQILKGFREDPNHPNNFIDGKVLDPRSGHIYSGKAKLSSDGRKFRLRGYVGISVLGRSQTWLRQE
ncbi:MAG: DUF2147 domain-containing protein [Moraxellaceae bacterium]|nr:MAG: DUF2147 domain-containing protein [Moraxellaceae bacterium]